MSMSRYMKKREKKEPEKRQLIKLNTEVFMI